MSLAGAWGEAHLYSDVVPDVVINPSLIDERSVWWELQREPQWELGWRP